MAPTPGLGCHDSVLGPPWPLRNVQVGGQMFCLVAQAGFRVPAATDLRKELSFPRQRTGRAAGSGQAPEAFLATPPTPQSST